MSTVYAKFQAGREWVRHVKAVPLVASAVDHCQTTPVRLDGGGAELEPGALVVECLRNDKGVHAAVVLPNGYVFPTGRVAPRDTWVPMLKAHLRSWLAMTPAGRIVRIVTDGVRQLTAQHAAGLLSADQLQKATAKLEGFRLAVTGELPPGVSETDLLAGFYNWVTEAAAQSKMSQAAVVAVVGRALRSGTRVQVPDLDEDVLQQDFQRFLDI